MEKNNEPNRKTRSQMREHIIVRLYQMDINDDFTVRKTPYDFVNEALKTISSHLQVLDALLEASLFNWKLKRLSFVDRAILRLAAYEMKFTDTPVEIIIDESLNLTHKFSDEGDKKHVSFNNRVLENLAGSLGRKEGSHG